MSECSQVLQDHSCCKKLTPKGVQFLMTMWILSSRLEIHIVYYNDKTCWFGLKSHTHRHQVALLHYVILFRLCKHNSGQRRKKCHLAAGARSLRITGFITTLSKMCYMSLFYCSADCHYAKSHGANKTIYHLRRHGQELDGRFSPAKVVGSDLSWPQCYKTFYGRN
jgi:hypothetical protein